MGTSKSFGELIVKLEKAAANLERSTPATVRAAAESAAKAIEDEIRTRVPDLDMSGLSAGGRKSGKVGTRVARAKIDKNAVAVRARGPVHWLESGTRAHLVGAGRVNSYRTTRGRYKKANAKFLMAKGAAHPVRGPLAHPGTKAQHTWSKGVRRAIPEAEQVFKRRTVADAFEPFT